MTRLYTFSKTVLFDCCESNNDLDYAKDEVDYLNSDFCSTAKCSDSTLDTSYQP